jgi:alcohol dehydrogenase class IV
MKFDYAIRASRIVFGRGRAATSLADEADRLGFQRVLLVSSEREYAEAAASLADVLGERVVSRFTGVRQHVPASVADEVRALAAKDRVDGILSIGGGSTTGTAKILALTSGIPILAIPTTYAGSELTPVWGMTTAARKSTGVDHRVQPRTVIYDSNLVVGLPFDMAVASGLNAMAHCIEALWSERSNPAAAALAVEGVRALGSGLHLLPSDSAAGADLLQYGGMLGGMSFATVGSGLHHKICHVLGGAFDLPHAQTHAVVLPNVVEFTAPGAPENAARIAAALGSTSAGDGLRALVDEVGAPRTLRELGMRPDQLDEAIDLVAAKLPIDNPRPVTREAIADILGAAYGGS